MAATSCYDLIATQREKQMRSQITSCDVTDSEGLA